jgi:hypothetical protein
MRTVGPLMRCLEFRGGVRRGKKQSASRRILMRCCAAARPPAADTLRLSNPPLLTCLWEFLCPPAPKRRPSQRAGIIPVLVLPVGWDREFESAFLQRRVQQTRHNELSTASRAPGHRGAGRLCSPETLKNPSIISLRLGLWRQKAAGSTAGSYWSTRSLWPRPS